jgi:hypothetical protein
VSTESIIDQLGGIEGLGKKKREALLEECPTLGHLEDMRRDASLKGIPFCQILPKGIGESIADELESRMLEALKF